MAQELERSTVRRVGRWLKWRGLRVVQLVGFALIGLGGYPFLRPLQSSVAKPPAVLDSFVASFYAVQGFGGVPLPTTRAVVFVAVGAVVVWVATSRRFH